MGILGSIGLASPTLMPTFETKMTRSGAAGPQIVGYELLGREGLFPEELAHQFQRGLLVSRGLDQHIEDFAFSVHCAPEIDHSPVGF